MAETATQTPAIVISPVVKKKQWMQRLMSPYNLLVREEKEEEEEEDEDEEEEPQVPVAWHPMVPHV